MNLISLRWSAEKEEGTVMYLKAFERSTSILQIDALDDWIFELTNLRAELLDKEHPLVRETLWGVTGD